MIESIPVTNSRRTAWIFRGIESRWNGGKATRRGRRSRIHASFAARRKEKTDGQRISDERGVTARRVVIGRLRLVVASDLSQAVAPPLVYAARRARGRLASSLRTASWSRPRTLSAIEPELRFVQRIASDARAPATALNATNSRLLERRTEEERGSDFDGSRRIRRIRGSFRLENRLVAASNAFVIVSIGD